VLTKDDILYKKSFDFAVQIIKFSRALVEEKKEFVLSKQLLRSGTSVGANIVEANGAISRADFSAKISIAYKESLETKYWLDLLKETNLLDEKLHFSLRNNADELSKILYSILKTIRIHSQ
jgi:four helix bundle protein